MTTKSVIVTAPAYIISVRGGQLVMPAATGLKQVSLEDGIWQMRDRSSCLWVRDADQVLSR